MPGPVSGAGKRQSCDKNSRVLTPSPPPARLLFLTSVWLWTIEDCQEKLPIATIILTITTIYSEFSVLMGNRNYLVVDIYICGYHQPMYHGFGVPSSFLSLIPLLECLTRIGFPSLPAVVLGGCSWQPNGQTEKWGDNWAVMRGVRSTGGAQTVSVPEGERKATAGFRERDWPE